MKQAINFRALAGALLVILGVSYIICIAGDLLSGWEMHTAWAPLLPGFTWPLSLGGFIAGALWIIFYSLYAAALFAIPYNFLARSRSAA